MISMLDFVHAAIKLEGPVADTQKTTGGDDSSQKGRGVLLLREMIL
jgi:hypothetical protein